VSECVFPCDVLGVVIDALGVDMRAGVCVFVCVCVYVCVCK